MVYPKGKIFVVTFLIMFAFMQMDLHADSTGIEQKIDVQGAKITGTQSDIGQPQTCFDGNEQTVMRSASINPAFVKVEFEGPKEVSKVRVFIGQHGIQPTIDSNLWWVDAADNENDLINKSGSYYSAIPEDNKATGGVWDEKLVKKPVEKKIWRINFRRITGDNYVHIWEIELYGINSSINTSRSSPNSESRTSSIAPGGSSSVTASPKSLKNSNIIYIIMAFFNLLLLICLLVVSIKYIRIRKKGYINQKKYKSEFDIIKKNAGRR